MSATVTQVVKVASVVPVGDGDGDVEEAFKEEPTAAPAATRAAPAPVAGGRTGSNWLTFFAFVASTAMTCSSLLGLHGLSNYELSAKYQTLVTPAAYSLGMWGAVFVAEGIWSLLQLRHAFAGSPQVKAVESGFWAVCFFQFLWTVVFAEEILWLSLVLMVLILLSLLFLVLRIDRLDLAPRDCLVFRAPFSLHLGWTITMTAANCSMLLDDLKAGHAMLLAAAILSLVLMVLAAAAFATLSRSPDPLVAVSIAWSLVAISVELADAEKLNYEHRDNAMQWEEGLRGGLRTAAACCGAGCLLFAAIAMFLRGCRGRLTDAES